MSHKHITTLGFVLAILGIVSTLRSVPTALADANDNPTARGVVATVITISANTGMARLRTEEGEVFERSKGWEWHVGHKVLCDRTDSAPRPRFLNCQPWESPQVHDRAMQEGPASRR